MDVYKVQQNLDGYYSVALPAAVEELGLKKGDNVVVVVNTTEKRIEVYPEAVLRAKAGIQ